MKKESKSKLAGRLETALKDSIAVARGERAPSRVWKVTKKADGSFTRELVDPEKVRIRNRAGYEKRLASEARAAVGLSQSKFAALLGVSINTLQNWEQGRRKPTPAAQVLLRIAARKPKVVLEAAQFQAAAIGMGNA